MKKRTFIMLLFIFLVNTVSLYSQYTQGIGLSEIGISKIKGGYKGLKVYSYLYKFGEIDTSSKDEKYSIKYDSFGNVIELHIGGWSVPKRFEFIENYTKSNVQFSLNDITIIAKYDVHGNRISEIWYNSVGEISQRFLYKYNDQDLLIEHNYDRVQNGNLSRFWSRIHSYDQEGRLIEISLTYRGAIDPTVRLTYSYPNNGKILETELSKTGEVINMNTYSMQIDKFGNIVERIDYDFSNEPIRKIVYFYTK